MSNADSYGFAEAPSLSKLTPYDLVTQLEVLMPLDNVLPLLSSSHRNHILRLRRQVSINWNGAAVLQYLYTVRGLRPWCWYVYTLPLTNIQLTCLSRLLDQRFKRVLPQDLDSHHVDNPYCLCGKDKNVESRILRATTRSFAEEWVAECATG